MVERLNHDFLGPGVIRLDDPNGAGKSTFVEAVSGYLLPLEGRLLVNGLPAHDARARSRRRVCRTAPALHPHLSVRDHLRLASDLAGVPAAALLEAAEALGLTKAFGMRIAELSTGMAKKLWFLICTAGDFDVAVLDEPFNAVDAAAVAWMCQRIDEWSRQALVLIVAHEPPGALDVTASVSLAALTKDAAT